MSARWSACWALILFASGCGAPLAGWHVRAKWSTACDEHRRLVVRDADGTLRELEHPRELGDAAWDQVEEGYYQITRGDGGWWLSEPGSVDYERGQHHGKLLWLADGGRPPEKLTFGRYAGVLQIAGETLAVRGECPLSVRDPYTGFYTIIERLRRTEAGWTRTELRRVGGLCPFNAIADEDGQILVLGVVFAASDDVMELFRIDAEGPPQTLGRFPSEYPWSVNVQSDWARPGRLILTQGWVNYDPANMDGWQAPPGRIIRLGDRDGEELRSSHIVRRCSVGGGRPRWSPSPPRSPERDLGISIFPARDGRRAEVSLLPDFRDLRAVVDHLRERGEPVVFEMRGIDLRGQAEEVLRLPPGSSVMQVESLSDAELRTLESARPDLFAR